MEKSVSEVTWQERAILFAMIAFCDTYSEPVYHCLFTPKSISIAVGKGGRVDSKLRASIARLEQYKLLEQSVWNRRRVVWLTIRAEKQLRAALRDAAAEVMNCG